MFLLFHVTERYNAVHYQLREQISLFGCKQGFIPYLLKNSIPSSQNEPYAWHLSIDQALQQNGYPEHSIVIDINPKKANEIFICKLLDVWGYSDYEWTPMMFRLHELRSPDLGKQSLLKRFSEVQQLTSTPIYSFLYVFGTVKNGSIAGKWTPPGPSSTNSVLLWPKPMRYFLQVIQEM
jgi:hypothetical protein